MEISDPSRGYILEVFDAHFVLPHRGPIGIITSKSLSLSSRKECYEGKVMHEPVHPTSAPLMTNPKRFVYVKLRLDKK